MRMLAQRQLLSVVGTGELPLADLRPHTTPWPLLIAARCGPTQSLADDAFRRDMAGVISLSAQEDLFECVALFGLAISSMRQIGRRLLNQGGQPHRRLGQALTGTMLPLVP